MPSRRSLVTLAALPLVAPTAGVAAQEPGPPLGTPAQQKAWYEAALAMRRLAESRGDQPYGAVVVLGGRIVGEAPSRVIQNRNADAHAEREALHAAQRALGVTRLDGALLVSTSRPCGACERAAAAVGIVRMIHGVQLTDGGAPRAD